MRRREFLLGAASITALFAVESPASAFLPYQPGPVAKAPGGCSTGYQGPGDVVSGALSWWGFRGYNAAYVNKKAVRLVRASDSTQQDFNILCGGSLDIASINTFLTATTGKIVTLYDQSGGTAGDLSNGTDANRTTYTASCTGTLLPCYTFASGNFMISPSNVSISAPWTMMAVGKRTSGTGVVMGEIENNGVTIAHYSISGDMHCVGGVSTFPTGVTENAFHAFMFVNASGTSNTDCHIDGTANTGTGTASFASHYNVGGSGLSGAFVGSQLEVGVWGAAFSSGQLSSMNSNVHAYWGF